MLINAYSDPILAVVRENVSNAVDATRAAGSTAAVEVISPTVLEPSLTVTDRGTGMSLADVEMAFLTFAGSTKRGTNDMIGGYGVGAKSAWALAESFLIDTVKDGRRTIVRAARDLRHQVLMGAEPSELPNGTTISIPVDVANDAARWESAIDEVATAHDSGVVRVDGQSVASIADSPHWIGPVAVTTFPNRSGRCTIRSGGTLFGVPGDLSTAIRAATGYSHCVLELPIGSFDHSVSRETVTDTARTRAAIDVALARYRTAYD
ncbi:MAG: ATP-binding protein, partial [Gordonia amarae]